MEASAAVEIGPLALDFSLPMLQVLPHPHLLVDLLQILYEYACAQCSKVAIRHVRLYDGGKTNASAHRWLRYLSQSDNYSWRY